MKINTIFGLNTNNYTNISFERRARRPHNLPNEIVNDILEGKISEHFVPTPSNITQLMIKALGQIYPGEKILEPSAGCGHIADKLVEMTILTPNLIHVIEPVEKFRNILNLKGYKLVDYNIENYHPKFKYDKIIMNPPFDNGSDIMHLLYCYDLLKSGGRLVCLLPEKDFIPPKQDGYEKWEKDWFNNGISKEINQYLQELLDKTDSKVIKLGKVFLKSDVPDDVEARMVIITKR